MPTMTFFLRNEPAFDGKPTIRECYKFVSDGVRTNILGEVVPEFSNEGHVDEGIKKEHSKNKDGTDGPYVKFKDYVEKNADVLYAECKEKGVCYPNYMEVSKPVLIEVEEDEEN